ncbi:hypothetical protein WJX81_003572 [Elliptochloris bilobata]|uniref:acetyl-CoA carboxytransferase n=1 Tax=Elliptochloris bilobata TaxID=381761 RepID=A0AAW1RKA0_9CHLO
MAESGFGLTRQAGRDWLQSLLSRFGPMNDKASNAHVLDFERPLVELDNRIKEVRKVAEDNGVDVSGQIKELEQRAMQLRKDTYARLTATQRLQVARHANRPTFLDIALNITDKFVELHGDRAGLDDPAIVCGLGSIDGISFMLIGHQKGRNTKENIYRNFGMPQPNGYRKALRFMKHANQFGFPILTFVDTPGAFAGKNAEELGQGEAIAMNLREMFGLRVPVISVVIGEGGSGGALAIGCANYNLIMEHSVYYVASPEACAAILWKSRAKAGAATEALKITAPDLVKAGVMDEIVREPLGGAHADPMGSFPYIKDAILNIWNTKYSRMTGVEVMADRYAKFRKLGEFSEYKVKGGRVAAAREERKQLQAAGGGFYAKTGQWAATKAEAAYIDRTVARNKAWVRSLQGKEQWLNRPQPDGEIDLEALTGGKAFRLPGAQEERDRLAARNFMRLRVVKAKRLVMDVRRRRGLTAANMMAERLGVRLKYESDALKAQLNGTPMPAPPKELPPLPPASKEERAALERRVRALPPARKAALAWAMQAPLSARESAEAEKEVAQSKR